jgi:hypothetical protein
MPEYNAVVLQSGSVTTVDTVSQATVRKEESEGLGLSASKTASCSGFWGCYPILKRDRMTCLLLLTVT